MNYLEVKINTAQEQFEVLQAFFSQFDFESFVDYENYFLAYIETNNFKKKYVENELKLLQNSFEFSYQINTIENKNWNEEWEKNFTPILVENKCLIRANFHPANPQIKDEIIITPKMSFGTGHHATTYMMVNKIYSINLNNKTVLDMGCGTAVLAILAKKRGSSYTLGIDIDDWAIENAKENCQINNCGEIEISKGDAKKLVNCEKFDVILANINRNILLNDIKQYSDSLKTNGEILFSGFYTEDNPLLIEKANELNFTLVDQKNRENWSLLHFKKN